jgi:hypothetical protein
MVRSPASRRQAAPQRAMGSRRANDGFPSSGHFRIEFFLLQGFRAVAGQVDGEVGDPRLRRAARGAGFIDGILPDLSAMSSS